MNLGQLKSPRVDPSAGRNKGESPKSSGALQINVDLRPSVPQSRTRYSSASAAPNPTLQQPGQKSRPKGFFRFFLAHKIVSLFLILMIIGGSFYMTKLYELRKTGLNFGVFDPVKTAITAISAPSDRAIDHLDQTEGRTNFLVVGVDARTYNDSMLTDSIIILSYDHKTNKVAQISFPRDLEAKYTIGKQLYDTKLNAAFPLTYADTKSFDESFENLGEALENISGLKVHYGMMINFRGFKEIVDTLGGITVDVENSFTDYQYPNDNDTGLITVSFKKGQQTMKGIQALQYARSRHSMDNGEGSDFMRARRQQKVMNAVKEKFVASDLFNKADSLNQIVSTLGNNIKFYKIDGDDINTGIQSRELLKQIVTFSMVIDPSFGSYTNHLMIGGDKGGSLGYAVTPNAKDYSEVKELIKFYMDNSFLLEEKSNVKLVWTDPKRYSDFAEAKKIFWNKALHFEFQDSYIKVVEPIGSTGTTLPTATPTKTTTPTVSTGTLYVLNPGKDKSVEFYKKLFVDGDIQLEVKQALDLPKELEKSKTGVDIMIVID